MNNRNDKPVLTMKDIVKEGDPMLRVVTNKVAIPPSEYKTKSIT